MALIRPGTNQIYGLPIKGQSHVQPPSGGGGGGGGGYVAKAVTLAPGGEMENAALACTDSPLISAYEWFKADLTATGSGPIGISLDHDNTGNAVNFDTNTPAQASSIFFSEPTFASQLYGISAQSFLDNAWNFAAYSVNCTIGDAILVINGVAATLSFQNVVPFVPTVAGQVASIYPQPTPQSYSDVSVWVGQYIDWTDPANLAKVLASGKPVDPAVSVAAFGIPTVLLSGDAATYGTNQGTGGDFTLIGVSDATTSPSD